MATPKIRALLPQEMQDSFNYWVSKKDHSDELSAADEKELNRAEAQIKKLELDKQVEAAKHAAKGSNKSAITAAETAFDEINRQYEASCAKMETLQKEFEDKMEKLADKMEKLKKTYAELFEKQKKAIGNSKINLDRVATNLERVKATSSESSKMTGINSMIDCLQERVKTIRDNARGKWEYKKVTTQITDTLFADMTKPQKKVMKRLLTAFETDLLDPTVATLEEMHRIVKSNIKSESDMTEDLIEMMNEISVSGWLNGDSYKEVQSILHD